MNTRTLLLSGTAVVLAASGTALAAPQLQQASAATTTPDHAAATTASSADRPRVPNLPDTGSATAAQTAAARDLLARTIAATTAYRDPAAATRAGFDVQAAWDRRATRIEAATSTRRHKDVGLVGVPNRANRKDGKVLDPTAPESLVYARQADGTFHLVGVVFTAERKAPPNTYQPYLRWHPHQACTGGSKDQRKPVNGSCPDGTTSRTGATTRLWFVDDAHLAQAFAVKPPRKALVAYQKALA